MAILAKLVDMDFKIENRKLARLNLDFGLKIGFLNMAILVTFWSIFEDRIANLGLIDFKIGLYIKVNLKAGQKEI